MTAKKIALYLTCAFALAPQVVAAQALPEFTSANIPQHEVDVANGKRIYDAAGCATCHSVDGEMDLLAGGRSFENRLGKVYAPNITADEAAGIGKWSDADFLNALLRGVSPDGRSYFGAFFPYPAYARMKVEDALDMRAYMATLPKSDAASKEHEVNLLGKTALRLMNSERPMLEAKSDPQLARGQYLVQAVGHCGECHTPRDFRGRPVQGEAMQGFFGFFNDYAPDISSARLENAGMDAFVNGVLVNGKKLNGRPMTLGSMQRIAMKTKELPLEDRVAMYAYLTGKPVDVPAGGESVRVEEKQPKRTSQRAETKVVADKTPAPVIEPEVLVAEAETTGSIGLMQRVASYCEAKMVSEEPTGVEQAKQPEITQVSNTAQVSEDIVTAADMVLDQKCRTCHGPGQRNERTFPMGDIYDMALDPSIVKPGDPEGSTLFKTIAANRMPIGTKMSGEEVDSVVAWIEALGASGAASTAAAPKPDVQRREESVAAGEPAPLPRFAGGSYGDLMMAAVADNREIRERDRPYIRYFSFANTPLPEVDCNTDSAPRNPMAYLHAGLNKFINSVSRGPRLVKVVPVEGTDGAMVRIDIRDYGWTFEDWRSLTTGAYTQGSHEAGFDEKAWGELAPVYPYAVDPSSDSLLGVLADATGDAVPVMDASWFTHHGSESPYYDLLLRLPAHIRDLERRMGVDADYNIMNGEVVRSGFTQGSSGVSDHNRMLERHDLRRGGYYWKSYDFAGSENDQSLLQHPDGPAELPHNFSGTKPFEHDGGEMIFSLDNGMQGYYLSNNKGDRLLVGPASIVSFRNKPIGKGVEVVNGRSCFDCHENGIIRKRDEIRDYITSSNVFDRDQMEALLQMYVEADELDKYYEQDMATFLAALKQLDATEQSVTGMSVSLRSPASTGHGEIMTFLSDVQFEALDLDWLARYFNLTKEEFEDRIRTIGDPHLQQIASLWVERERNGLTITRVELEDVFAHLLARMTDYEPLGLNKHGDSYVPKKPIADAEYDKKVVKAVETAYEEADKAYVPPKKDEVPEYKAPPPKPKNPLHLELAVPYTKVKVDDLLEFTVKSNRDCELQILYIEESKAVQELIPEIVGPAILKAGEHRKIPYSPDYRIRFNTPGYGEAMVAYCREGGLGKHKLTAEEALDYTKKHFQPLTRGIIQERAEVVAKDNGNSAVNAVTFDVSK